MDDWQMQCCGEPFRIGDRLLWTVNDPDPDYFRSVLGPDRAATVTHHEEHHDDGDGDLTKLSGTVTAIQAVRCQYAPRGGSDDRTLYPVEGTADVRDVVVADGWEADDADLRFVSYLVDLDDI